MGQRPPVYLGTTHTRIETSTTRRGFNYSLSMKLINLLLNNGMMSCSCLDIKLPNCQKLWNKGGWDLSWRWWPQTILSINLLDILLLHWSKYLKSMPTWKAADVEDEEAEEAEDSGTSGVPTPMAPFLLVTAELVETLPPADFLSLEWASFSHTKWGLLAKDAPLGPGTDLDTGPLLYCEMESSLWSGLATPLRRKDWDKPTEDWWWACARDQLIWSYRQASTRRNHIPKTVKKRELWSPYLMTLPGNRIKQMC